MSAGGLLIGIHGDAKEKDIFRLAVECGINRNGKKPCPLPAGCLFVKVRALYRDADVGSPIWRVSRRFMGPSGGFIYRGRITARGQST